jgi:hypothetical protein
LDILIDKPAKVRGYALHRLVEQYQQGKPALWVDEGKQVRIRSRDSALPAFEVDKILGFTAKACVAYSSGNRHVYLPLDDWRGRRQWLEKKAIQGGFEIVGVHVSGGMEEVQTHDGRRFTVDATEFTGLLKVVDLESFQKCYLLGLGKVGKAFGLNMIVIE